MKKLAFSLLVIMSTALLLSCDPDAASAQQYSVTYRVTSGCSNLGISYVDEDGTTVILSGQASGFEVSFTGESGDTLSLSGSSGCVVAVFSVTVTIEVDGAAVAEVTQNNGASTTYALP